MCGITGYLDWASSPASTPKVIEDMTTTLHLRGPDARGTWSDHHAALGHTRLAIIDLAGGQQPMISLDEHHHGHLVLTFSGEIYNHDDLRRELRARGHRFRTRSDTEVVLEAYRQWGPDCVDRLNGMFAFAIWDTDTETLFLARDRLGVKPLYFYRTQHGVVFGSELKAILAHPDVPCELDGPGIAELFTMVPMTTPGTAVLRGMEELQPGWTARCDRAGAHLRQYWRLESRPHTDDEATTIDTIRGLLEDIVDRQVRADVPICSLLSGGLDSSAIAALAARKLGQQGQILATHAVDYVSDEVNYGASALHVESDTPFAEEVAKHIGSAHTTHYVMTGELLAAQEAAQEAMDLPSLSPINTSLLVLFRRIRPTATAALSGESADELFGGYRWYHDRGDYGHNGFPWHATYRPMHHLLRDDVAYAVQPEQHLEHRYRQALADVPHLDGETGHDRRIREVFHLTNQRYLRFLLHRKDALSLAAGVEARVPFCDHRLAEYAWNIPWAMKNTGGLEKGILRKATEDLLPAHIAWRKKSGYPAAQTREYQQHLWAQMRDLLADPNEALFTLLDRRKITALLDRHAGDLSSWDSLLTVSFSLECAGWMRRTGVQVR